MTLPTAAPGEDGPRSREHFSHQATEPKSRWYAYLAGPPMWFWCHQPKRTKPCLAILTNRAVECPWCGTEKPIQRLAYVPLYRAVDNAPRCVIVGELYEEVLDRIRLHERIQVGKEEKESDPVWVVKALTQQPVFHTTLRHRFGPVDLTQSLLRIWGSEPLRQWYAKTGGQTDKPVSLPKGTAVGATGEPVSPMLQAAAKRQGFDVLAPATDDDAAAEKEREILRALQSGGSKNGHHKRTKPKG